MRTLVRLAAAALLLVLLPFPVAALALPDGPMPASVRPLVERVEPYVRGEFHAGLAAVRYEGIEVRESDRLVVLYLEVRPYPFVAPRHVWVASRCASISEIVAEPYLSMGGGVLAGERASDPELAYLRSDAQPPCSPAGSGVVRRPLAR